MLNDLLGKFAKNKPKATTEMVDDTFEDETSTTSLQATTTIGFLKLCSDMHLKPMELDTSAQLEKYVIAGMLERTKLPRGQLKILQKAEMPPGAMFEYKLSEKQNLIAAKKTDKSSYKVSTQLNDEDENHNELRQNKFENMGSKMATRLSKAEPEEAPEKPAPKRVPRI
jgi:hypothetical protein